MSIATDGSDFATFMRFKQWESRNQRLEGNPHPSNGSQHPANQGQRPVVHRLSPPRSRPQPYRQPPPRNPADFSTISQALDDVKKSQDEIYVALNTLQTVAEQIKKTVDEGVTMMIGTMARFETVGRDVLQIALEQSNSQPSNSQPSNGASSQPQTSNPPQLNQHAIQPPIFSNAQKIYQGPNAIQPPAPLMASSNHTQPLYAPASQAPEPYSEPYLDYAELEFLNNTS